MHYSVVPLSLWVGAWIIDSGSRLLLPEVQPIVPSSLLGALMALIKGITAHSFIHLGGLLPAPAPPAICV